MEPTKEHSASIKNATELVVKAAVNMQRSDSVLCLDDDDENDNDNDDDDSSMSMTSLTASTEEEEQFAVETMLSNSMRATHIAHARRVSSVKSSMRSSSSMSGSDEVGELGEQQQVHDVVGNFQRAQSLSLHNEEGEQESLNESFASFHSQHETFCQASTTSTAEILQSCGAMPLSMSRLADLYHSKKSDREICSALLNARRQSKSRDNNQQNNSTPESVPETLEEKDEDEEAMLLHSLFATLCSPPPTLSSVSQILANNQQQNVELPRDALVHMEGKASIISVLQNHRHLLNLPPCFLQAFFRILIRLLTNETDTEYNQECLLECSSWMSEDDDESSSNVERQRAKIRTMREKSLHPLKSTKAERRRPNQLYTIVRFRTGTAWNDHGDNNAVTSLLQLFTLVMEEGDDGNTKSILLAPVARLIGLCATAGVEVKDLRRMLTLASSTSSDYSGGVERLLLIRALSTAAEGASRSSLLVGKASPRYFFDFGLGHGLARTFRSISTWPFRNDFGIAVWFRAERFSHEQTPKLFSAQTYDGGGIEVSLMPLKAGGTPAATVITVTVFDSQPNGKDASGAQQVKLEKCILLPQVWYHVAVRHTRSRLKGVFSMSSRSQVSIMLDGKLMLTEPLRFPKIQMSDGPSEGGGLLLRGRRQTAQHGTSGNNHNGSTMTIQCGANFEGQTGAFYVFNDNVSDTTLRALYDITGGTDGVIKKKSLEDSSWDERRGEIANRSHALSVEITKADVEEIVLSSHENDHRSPGGSRHGSSLIHTLAAVADMGDGEGHEDSDLPVELSKASLASRLFMVWDPKRVEEQFVLDLHSGAHVKMDADKVQPCHVDGAQSVIASIGGVQALIPVFRAALSGDVERHWQSLGDKRIQDENHPSRIDEMKTYIMIPSLLSLLSSFVRDHGENAREMLRCGGIDILEQLLAANKALNANSDEILGQETLMSVLTVYPALSRLLVMALLDVRSACSHYTGLETIVFSRLLFNLQLWFAGPSQAHGVALYGTLLPVLSSLSHTTPRKVRDCVGVRRMVELLRDYLNIGDKQETREALTDLFDRSPCSGLERRDPLSVLERRHVIDIILAMVCTLLASGTLPEHLQPLLNFISYKANIEWEQASKDMKDGDNRQGRTGTRHELYLANMKAATVLLCILQIRPDVVGLTDSFAQCCSGELGAAGWILCCLVNTFDDEMRSIGLRCLSAYLDKTAPGEGAMLTAEVPGDASSHSQGHSIENAYRLSPSLTTTRLLSSSRFTNTISTMGKGLADAIGNSAALSQIMHSSKVNVKVVYKLLWHFLKFHRERSEKFTHVALLQILLENPSICSLEEFVIRDDVLRHGYIIGIKSADTSSPSLGLYSDENFKQTPVINTVLRLLRFLPKYWREEWLRVFVKSSASAINVKIISSSSEWQPPLFHLVSDIAEEMAATCSPAKSTLEAHLSQRSDIESSFDLSFKLYANVLGHYFRHGGEQALQILEQAASLQRTCINGHEVLTLILSHLLADLNTFGTSDTPVAPTTEHSGERSRLLIQSARMVTNVIMSNGNDGFDTTTAIKQWRCLRHLTAVVAEVVTKSGFGVSDLFDYRNQHAESLDELSGGVYGIRLSESNLSGMSADDYARVLSLGSQPKRGERNFYRQICVLLSSQMLSLLDSFIFPESLDASLPASQLHGLALVRSNEPRLGFSQGPILASLVRLSLVLLSHLEPSGVRFLQCCSRLRCFVHWILELIRESVSLAGYSAAFDELTAPLDRLLLAIVLQCHRGLARCSAVLVQIEASEYSVYFPSEEVQKKSYKRVLRVALELREIVLAAYRGRNEVLRAALSRKAFDALQTGLESNHVGSKEAVIRAFLSNDWVSNFHDVDLRGNIAIPAQITDGQDLASADTSQAGVKAIEALAAESNSIISDFNRTLDTQFEAYCEYQRQWAETDAVRDLEYEGDSVVQRLSAKHRSNFNESAKQLLLRADAAQSRFLLVERNVIELWKTEAHWKLAEHTDRLNRRILLVRNRDFNDHHDASYELMLTQEREKAERDREERERKKRKKQEEDLSELVRRNADAFVPYGEISDIDVEDDNFEDMDERYPKSASEQDNDDLASTDCTDTVTANETNRAPGGATALDDFKYGEDETERIAESIHVLDGDAWAKTFIWSSTESVVARFEFVSIVSLQTITEGRLLLTTHGLYFNQTGDKVSVMTKESVHEHAVLEPGSLRWRLSRLTEVHGRRFMLRSQALELFFSDSHELFLNFAGGTRERDRFYAKMRNSCKIPLLWSPKSLNPRSVFKKSQLTQLWRQRKISNFQYLMQLNKMAGRTFNDITQYPVFPWVLADYTSEDLDLSDSRVYRDLSKPVGALNPDRLSQLIERYNELESFGFAANERFLYGSHYSSPGVILHYMLRQEPFTTMAIELQSGRFDCPDRLFFDIAGCWNSCMTSTSDVKELIPEFFTCPEILLNTNNFPLGSTQAGRPIHNVGLPPWAKGSAHEFVRIHRLALESDFVSRNLHHWIDLIFGYKQRGPEAESAHNIFHYLSYEGAVDLDKITDEIDRCAAESHIQNFGQTPCQLLVKDPHPSRYSASDSWQPLINDTSVPKLLRCYQPPLQFGGKHGGVTRGSVASIHVMTESLVVIYADLSMGSYKWYPRSREKHLVSLKMDKHKNLARRELSTSRSAIKRGSATPQSMDGGRYAVGNWSFGVTVGGQAKENLRRKAALAPSRLAPAMDTMSSVESSSLLVSCGYWDDTVKVHSIDGSKLLCSVTGGHRGPVRCLAVGLDGGLMITGGEDGTCRVWLVDHPDMAIALSDGYVQTALGASNGREQLLSCCHVLWGHETAVSCVALSSDLDVAVSGSVDGTVCVHTVRRGEFIRSIQLKRKRSRKVVGIRNIVLDTHGTFVAHTEDGALYAYTINGVFLCCVDAREQLHAMKITSNGEILVTGGENGHLVVRTLRDLHVLSMLNLSQHGPIRCITLTPEELNPIPQFLFVGSDDGLITIVDRDPLYSETESKSFDPEMNL